MVNPPEDIASQLLQSTDARIAEAAKRVFSSSYPVVSSNATSHAAAQAQALSSSQSYHRPQPSSAHHSTTSDISSRAAIAPPSARVSNHGKAEPNSINSPAPLEAMHANEMLECLDDGVKKPSSTDRLLRRLVW